MANKKKDPVCGMDIDPNSSKYKADHQGKPYSFCCQQCLNKFKQNPNQYTSKK